MEQQRVKTYLIYGDSGAGKSSFIKYLKGVNEQNEEPQTGGKGDSCTKKSAELYYIEDEILGKFQIIDTKGTWDPSSTDNQEIVESLVQCLIDFSVQNMNINCTEKQQIDGIIFVHTALQYDRYAKNQRIAHLSTLIGKDLTNSTLTLFSHYNSIMKLDKEKVKFDEMVQAKNFSDDHQVALFVYWDSLEEVEQQKQALKDQLEKLKPIDLANIESSNKQIIDLAKQLRENDKVETLVIKHNVIDKSRMDYEFETCIQINQFVLTIDVPQSYTKSMLTMFTNKFDYLYSIQNEEILKIVPEYPKKSLNPRQILSCSISSKKFVNAEFIEEPLVIIWESQLQQFENKGDYLESCIKYKWKSIESSKNLGRIDLTIKTELQYRIGKEYKYQVIEEEKTYQMLPRYPDEKPYLKEAQEQLIKGLIQQVQENLQQN